MSALKRGRSGYGIAQERGRGQTGAGRKQGCAGRIRGVKRDTMVLEGLQGRFKGQPRGLWRVGGTGETLLVDAIVEG